MTDDLLIDKTLAGDTAAFGDLVQKYQDRLFHSISHVLGSVQDAEDVLQETFVQAFLKLELPANGGLLYLDLPHRC